MKKDAISGKTTKKVEFGTAFVSKTVSGTTTNYVIVVFEKKA